MRIPLDRRGPVPVFRQIEDFFRQGIQSGSFPPGTRLPAIRELAQDLGVNRITVENAFRELAADGWVAGRVGSGTYVQTPVPRPSLLSPEPAPHWPLWQQEAASRTAENFSIAPPGRSADGKKTTPVLFSGGSGDPRLFPAEAFRKVLNAALRKGRHAAFQYGPPRGYPPLLATIAGILGHQGLRTDPENILITGGSQQALALVAQLLLAPGDPVLVESPTYSGALDLFRAFRCRIIGVPTDDRGLSTDLLEPLLQQHHPKLIYTIPNFHNPTGTCLTEFRRRQLVVLAQRYNVPILEDDYVGDLRYEGRAQPSLKSLDPGGGVIYVSTFSKMLLPGLRIGFLVADGPVFARLATLKRAIDLATSHPLQLGLESYLSIGRYQSHLRRSRQLYRQRRDAMLAALERFLPSGAMLTPPQGGLFVWLRLPPPLAAGPLLDAARAEGVDFQPGPLSFPEPAAGNSYIRLCFAGHPPEAIEKGVRRLAKAMRKALAQR